MWGEKSMGALFFRAARLRRFLYAVLGLLVGLSSLPLRAESVLTDVPGAKLEALLALAREGNPDYAALLREAEAAEARVEPAGNLPDPRLRAEWMDITRGGTQNPNLLPARVGSMRYTLMQELPWFGKRALRREQAELEAGGAKQRAEGGWNEVASRIRTTFVQLYFVNEAAAIDRESLNRLADLEKLLRSRYAQGLASQQSVLRAQQEQTVLRNGLLSLDSEKRRLQARMNVYLGRPVQASLLDPEGFPPWPEVGLLEFSALEARVRKGNPEVVQAALRAQSAQKGRELAERNRYPDLTVGFAPSQFQHAVRQWDVMVEVSIPIQQSSRQAREQEAGAAFEAARLREEAVIQQKLGELLENLSAFDAARRAETLIGEGLLPQAELVFRSVKAGYEAGREGFAALLEALQQLRQARLERLKVQVEAQFRRIEIERIVGGAL